MQAWAEDQVLDRVVTRVCDGHARFSGKRAALVGLSGIDASGKSFLASQLTRMLEDRALRLALLNVDSWLNLPQVRFSNVNPGRHFYQHGLRLQEMFEQLVLPLCQERSINLEIDYAEETAQTYRRQRFEFHDVDVVLVEGIFIFKRKFRPHFDLTCWVDCSFETALKRAIQRGQEGLPAQETIRAYEEIYWPAQRVHFERDRPREMADLVINNDKGLPERGLKSAATTDCARISKNF